MKRPNSCDSLGALMSICPSSTDEHNRENINPIYTMEFQTMLEGLEEDGCVEKKRRLSVEQVKALEKNFEVENKLEPERKVKLAQELGLQPRQVAVWFQNRRARCKTKQLERDYGVLKAKYDGLLLDFESLKSDNEALVKEIRELKWKVKEGDDNNESKGSVKEEEALASDTEENKKKETNNTVATLCDENETNLDLENLGATVFVDFKDGSSDESDSSAISSILENSPLDLHSASLNKNFLLTDSRNNEAEELVKIEEHNFFGEESCMDTLFSDDQPPTLQWYTAEDWN